MNIERFLIGFVGYSVLCILTKHHLRAVHEILHHVFKGWHQSLVVNRIEKHFSVRCDLYSGIAHDIVYESSLINLMIFEPLFFARELIKLKLKKQYLTGASHDKCLFIDQEHDSQVLVVYPLLIVIFFVIILSIRNFFHWHPKGFTLPIERVDLVVIGIIEAFLREVLAVTVHLDGRVPS